MACVAVPHAIEEGYTTARYDPGSPEQGIAGGLMINTSHLDQRPLYELPALVAHEGAPGHHIQIALAQELTGLPVFRRDLQITAFVEGWALYAEQLGAEMGLYATPYERFGLLSMEMWRACRLVMDVGIHWRGWTRDQALACLRDNTALAERNMQSEVDRYIAWPGQALGYKVGELRILALRHRAEAGPGPAFRRARLPRPGARRGRAATGGAGGAGRCLDRSALVRRRHAARPQSVYDRFRIAPG